MDKIAARKLVKDTFERPFDKPRFTYFAKNLFQSLDQSRPFTYQGNTVPKAYQDYISSLERVGQFTDSGQKKIDTLIVRLKKETSLERARTMQRNFIAWYLNGSRDYKDAALVAFLSPDEDDWRFSLVKMEYNLDEKGKPIPELTPARRWSFLVGAQENSHTAQSQLEKVLEKEERPSLISLEQAFNVEVVTREFFNQYRELFHGLDDALQRLISKNEAVRNEFTAKRVDRVSFAKKLLGQIVFLYFLQKKGWLGVPEDRKWGDGDKRFLRNLFRKAASKNENFFNCYLEFLFYDALARQRITAAPEFYPRFNCKIPFLNGGLFDPINNYDWSHTDLLLPNELFSNRHGEDDEGTGILDIFDLYNFTVREDEPLEKEVAIDPEMLGKVFENLLEVNDRKSKGTYYTPREIVHYMCQESLINYLDIAINTAEAPLAKTPARQGKLIGSPDPHQATLKTTEYRARVPYDDIEFLVRKGELIIQNDEHAQEHGESEAYAFQLPESVRSHAQLLDEKLRTIRVCDPAIGSGAFPVGMMTEIVRARNVLTAFLPKDDRSNYNFKRDAIQNCLYGVDIDTGAVEIAKLRLWLSLVVDEEDIKQIQPLPNLDYKVVCGNSLLGVEKDLFNIGLFNQLEVLKIAFFKETNINKKQDFRKQIDGIIKQIARNNPNFDYQVYFSEVFHEKGGFDVVIGNPPYLEARSPEFSDSFKDQLREAVKRRWGVLSEYITRGSDLLIYFYDISLSIISDKGRVVLLTENSWLDTLYGKKFQEFLIKTTYVRAIIDSDFKYFDGPNVNTIISMLEGRTPMPAKKVAFTRFHENFEKLISFNKLDMAELLTSHEYQCSDVLLKEMKWGILLCAETELLELIKTSKNKGKYVHQIPSVPCSIGQGLNLTKDYQVSSSFLEEFPSLRQAAIPLMTSADGAPFELHSTSSYLIDSTKIDRSLSALMRQKGIKAFTDRLTRKVAPVLILPRGISRHYCAMNPISAYSASFVEVYGEIDSLGESRILNLWLFLNSSIAWLFREISGRKNLGGGLLKAEAADLNQFPVYFDFADQAKIKRVFELLRERQALDSLTEIETHEHIQIDDLVFHHLNIADSLRGRIIDTLKSKIKERNAKSKT